MGWDKHEEVKLVREVKQEVYLYACREFDSCLKT